MYNLIEICILWPILGFFILIFIPKSKEKLISFTSFAWVLSHLFILTLLGANWIAQGRKPVNIKELSLYKGDILDFYIDFYFDGISLVFAIVGALLTFMVVTYSRLYLHRDEGFKRFFVTIMLFYSGYMLTVISGNLETLFVGWEIVGLTSFLLISFYRNRYLPVKNAFRVYSIYRIGDVGLLLAIWASHHLWHENISFAKLNNLELVHHHLEGHSWFGIFIGMMFLISAVAKSAQFPFTSWLPRAMEGPTPSSAIFYGALSVHLGLFLLLRTHVFWMNQGIVVAQLVLIGLITSIISTQIARVQSTVKSQIAYSSAAQIGLMMVELALGFEIIVLIHFAGNAFLRSYQLLVSPSTVSYLIQEQFFHFDPTKRSIEKNLPQKLKWTLYTLSVMEWRMDVIEHTLIWKPLKRLGQLLTWFTPKTVFALLIPSFTVIAILIYYKSSIPDELIKFMPGCFAFLGLLFVLKSYASRKSSLFSWILVMISHFWSIVAVSFNETLTAKEAMIYLSGVTISGILGVVVISYIKKREKSTDMNAYYGHIYEYPWAGLLFLLACLGMAGFPITPTFIGEDILFSHVKYSQVFLALYLTVTFVISGLAVIRIYSRMFLGNHIKTYHEQALKSA